MAVCIACCASAHRPQPPISFQGPLQFVECLSTLWKATEVWSNTTRRYSAGAAGLVQPTTVGAAPRRKRRAAALAPTSADCRPHAALHAPQRLLPHRFSPSTPRSLTHASCGPINRPEWPRNRSEIRGGTYESVLVATKQLQRLRSSPEPLHTLIVSATSTGGQKARLLVWCGPKQQVRWSPRNNKAVDDALLTMNSHALDQSSPPYQPCAQAVS